ncbi:MAG: phosphoribosylamine--glycine ligase [Myxococcales bacterium]|nr:phosphoribosylamine--glycine ligase [Myxococcales bacterium]
MRAMVIGSGGREHALVRVLADSPRISAVVAAPGNPGMASTPKTRCLAVSADNVAALTAAAVAERVDLVVVGPEAPLVGGLVDALHAAGIRALGPTAAAARLEGSKAFAKEVMASAGIPTAASQTFTDLAAARCALPDGPVVIKADGLAAGKGVVVAPDRATAEAALVQMLGEGRFGVAGATVLVEEHLAGEEVSVIALCDGQRALCFPAAQDHKRIGEGDTGPNTGGMGAYVPAPALDAAGLAAVQRTVIEPVLADLQARGTPFVGFLFAGLMLTAQGPKVLEFNVRLGDPEAQVLLALLDGDPVPLLVAAADGALPADAALPLGPGAAACVVLAAEGYPAAGRRGDPIEGLAAAEALPDTTVVHAGTRREGEQVVTAGGRVLGVVGRGDDLRQALDRAYAGCTLIRWPGQQLRRDIGHRALARGG